MFGRVEIALINSVISKYCIFIFKKQEKISILQHLNAWQKLEKPSALEYKVLITHIKAFKKYLSHVTAVLKLSDRWTRKIGPGSE
jgi:hypothetical protein